MVAAYLRCPECHRRWTLEDIFDHSDVSWPNQSWIAFACPSCERDSHILVTKGEAAIGEVDGAPGPCFIEAQRAEAEDLDVQADGAGVTIRLGDRSWSIPAKQ